MIVAIMVFISTLALRQHVLLDVAAGILLAEVTYCISWHTNGYRTYMRIADRLAAGITEKIEGMGYGKQKEDVI